MVRYYTDYPYGPITVFEAASKTDRLLENGGATNLKFDDKGVFWTISQTVDSKNFIIMKLYDGSETEVISQVDLNYLGYDRCYQGGYVAWDEARENTITTYTWVSYPEPAHWEERQETIWDMEVFFYSPDGGVRQLTENTIRNEVGPSGPGDLRLDNGLVVWRGHGVPPPPPAQPPPLTDSWPPYTWDIFLGGLPVQDLRISPEDISLDRVLQNGENATITATVHNEGLFPVNNVKILCLVPSSFLPIWEYTTIATIGVGASANVTIQWPVSWKMKDKVKNDTEITIFVDFNDEIYEVNEENNVGIIRIPRLEKGKKRDDADGRGFVVPFIQDVPYAVPIAIWFDDDATSTAKGLPTRHYNPIATSDNVLDKIDTDFDRAVYPRGQYPNGRYRLDTADFVTAGARDTVKNYWQTSSGIILVSSSSISGKIEGASIASYLNWPMLPALLLDPDSQQALVGLINELGVSYVLAIADDQAGTDAIVAGLQGLPLPLGKSLFVKTVAVEPLDNNKTAEAFEEALEAFHDYSSGIVVTNSRGDSCFAAAPLAAFYRSILLDVRDVVTSPVSYAADNYIALDSTINSLVSGIIDKAGSDHDIKGLIHKDRVTWGPAIFLVGTVEDLPFGIEQDPMDKAGIAEDCEPTIPGEQDADSDWIASDYRYYHADPLISPGGRMPLASQDNVDYVARALQLAELPLGSRGAWKSNILGAGIYNINGKRNWGANQVWWLDSIVYQLRDLSGKEPGIVITRLFEDVSAHGGGPGQDWEQPVFWDIGPPSANQGPGATGNRGDGIDNDGDGLNNEEIWDNFDNDGDHRIDEDCSYWHLVEVEDVYREKLGAADPEIGPGDFLDLIDTNLVANLGNQGMILYSGHAWSDVWQLQNMGGAGTTDNRSDNETSLLYNEVPPMKPALIIASACGSSRAWEPDCIALAFLKQGALAYIGATSVAYSSSDELRQQMLNCIRGGKLNISGAFQFAVDNLDQNGLWAQKSGESGNFTDKTRYQFNLFGLGTTEVDPGGDGEERITYGSPVYNSANRTWSVNITCDIPAPSEIRNASGNVTEFLLPFELPACFSASGNYPALRSLPFNFLLPIGGRLVNVSLAEAAVHKAYNFSLHKAKDQSKGPLPKAPGASPIPEEELGFYQGSLYPDALFVSASENISQTNSNHIYGSVTAFQVDGTIPKTTVYDKIVLEVTYTVPLGLQETHIVAADNVTIQATVISTDGKQHIVIPTLSIETVGGLTYQEVSGQEVNVGLTPQTVNITASDIHMGWYVGRISLTEAGVPVAEITFKVVRAGDASGDGRINALDITRIERIITGLDAATPSADANQDSKINALDITKVERIITGLD